MKKIFHAAAAAAVLAAATSCEHKELCYDHSDAVDVEVVFDWCNAPDASPESMSLYLFPAGGGEALRYEFTDCRGGTIRVPVGGYEALCLNSDTENVTYRNAECRETFEVTTRTADLLSGLSVLGVLSDGVPRVDGTESERVILPPDMLWSDCAESVELKPTAGTPTVTLSPEMSICRYTVEHGREPVSGRGLRRDLQDGRNNPFRCGRIGRQEHRYGRAVRFRMPLGAEDPHADRLRGAVRREQMVLHL